MDTNKISNWEKIKIVDGKVKEGKLTDITDFDIKDFSGSVEFIYHFIERNTFKNKEFDFSPVLEDTFSFAEDNFVNAIPVIHFCRDFVQFNEYFNLRPYAPRYIQFLDSSIWQMIAWDASNLKDRIKKIKKWYDEGYYDLVVAKETANLQRRLVQNAYIAGPTERSSEYGHAAAVSPFLFHSETKMQKLLFDEARQNASIINKNIEWRVLLLDDHAREKMSVNSGAIKKLTKVKILEDRLDELCKIINLEREKAFTIVCVKNVDEAKSEIKKKRFYLILLDYLLAERNGRREYSYELLDFIDRI